MAKNRDDKRVEAREILAQCCVRLGEDFHRLDSSTVCRLIVYADDMKYRKPANANGSRGRYFHDMLQRRASAR